MSSTPLLSFERASKYHVDGRRRVAVLADASFQVHAGESVGIWGARRAGKTTLLRLAAGIERVDDGSVCFLGSDLSGMRALERERLLRNDIGLVSPLDWRPGHHERVVDYVALPLLSTGVTLLQGSRAALAMLERLGAGEISDRLGRTLSVGERMRPMLARALINEPRMLLIDEPAIVPSLTEREELGELLGDLARERRVTLMVASEDMSSLRCTEVLMSIGAGELVRSNEQVAEIVPFPTVPHARLERPAR
jgi:ABC-type lipoprotein export system ATPase subunit